MYRPSAWTSTSHFMLSNSFVVRVVSRCVYFRWPRAGAGSSAVARLAPKNGRSGGGGPARTPPSPPNGRRRGWLVQVVVEGFLACECRRAEVVWVWWCWCGGGVGEVSLGGSEPQLG